MENPKLKFIRFTLRFSFRTGLSPIGEYLFYNIDMGEIYEDGTIYPRVQVDPEYGVPKKEWHERVYTGDFIGWRRELHPAQQTEDYHSLHAPRQALFSWVTGDRQDEFLKR